MTCCSSMLVLSVTLANSPGNRKDMLARYVYTVTSMQHTSFHLACCFICWLGLSFVPLAWNFKEPGRCRKGVSSALPPRYIGKRIQGREWSSANSILKSNDLLFSETCMRTLSIYLLLFPRHILQYPAFEAMAPCCRGFQHCGPFLWNQDHCRGFSVLALMAKP